MFTSLPGRFGLSPRRPHARAPAPVPTADPPRRSPNGPAPDPTETPSAHGGDVEEEEGPTRPAPPPTARHQPPQPSPPASPGDRPSDTKDYEIASSPASAAGAGADRPRHHTPAGDPRPAGRAGTSSGTRNISSSGPCLMATVQRGSGQAEGIGEPSRGRISGGAILASRGGSFLDSAEGLG